MVVQTFAAAEVVFAEAVQIAVLAFVVAGVAVAEKAVEVDVPVALIAAAA